MNLFKREVLINWKYSYLSMITFIFVLLFAILGNELYLRNDGYYDLVSSTSFIFIGAQGIIAVSGLLYVKNDNKNLFLIINESRYKLLISKLSFLFISVTIQFLFSVAIYFIVKLYFGNIRLESFYSSSFNIFTEPFKIYLLYIYVMFAALYVYSINFRDTVMKYNYNGIRRIQSLLLSFSFMFVLFGVHKVLLFLMNDYYDFAYSLIFFFPFMIYLNFDSIKRGEL